MLTLLMLACTPDKDTGAPPLETGDTGQTDDTDTDTGEPCTDVWYADEDGDGYGGASLGTACDPPAGAVAEADDCDDADSGVHPGATDVCDGLDNDCDATTVESGASVDGVPAVGSLADAIAGAADGAVLSLCAGTYTESLLIERSLTVRGLSGASATTLEGVGGAVITVAAGSVTIEGLTITGGTDGGVSAALASDLTLTDCAVVDNEGVSGAGVYGPTVGLLTITGGSYTGNEAEEYGGAIHAVNVAIDAATIEGNTALDGGGVFIEDGGAATLSNTSFGSNEALNIGGGAYVGVASTVESTASTWVGNRAAVYAAGVYMDENATYSDVAGVYDNLVSEDKGGAFYVRYASLTLQDGTFTGNSGSWGGQVFLYGSTLSATNTTFRYGAADLASAIYVYMESDATLTDCAVEGNTSGSGGAVRLRSTATLTSANTGWGADGSDNIPTDVDVSNAATYIYADAATFTCDTTTVTCE